MKQVTVLTGMRRTGKTTLVKQLLETSDAAQKVYFDLERIDNRLLFSEENCENIIAALIQRGVDFSEKVLLAIDEIQLLPNLPSVVKYLYDNYHIKFLLSGSSSYYLKNRFNESLAGRKQIFEIFPLSFGELLVFKQIPFKAGGDFTETKFIKAEFERLRHFYEEFINFGGFPEVVLTQSIKQKTELINDILSSYINLDIMAVADFRKITEIYKLIKLLAVRVGTKLDISKLTSLTSMSRQTVENYLDLFEQSYLLKTIPVTSNSPDREIVKARKIYFTDNGIASASAELSSGAKFENAVFNQLRNFGEISYYQRKTGNEIDFVLDKNIAFEVKETATDHDLRNLQRLAQNLNIEKTYVIGRHPNNVFDGFIWGGFIQ
jgi:predicted AAA+ superfamily ATPase